MNRNIKLSLLALAAVLLSSCSDFLSVDQKGRATIPSFLGDPSGLKAGLVGAYNEMYAYLDNEFTKYGDVAGNMVSMPAGASDMIDQYNYTSDASQETGAVGYIWRKIYVAQANVNNIIQYAPTVKADYPENAALCDSILGQALLLRALCHFDQCRAYAQPYNYTADASHLGVPVLTITPGPDDNVSRRTVKEVYDQVLADLTQASTLLSGQVTSNYRYASLQAVNAMFSRVYLYMENWEQALAYAKRAIAGQQLAQGSDYLRMFSDLSYQGEAIFRLSGQDRRGYLRAFYDASCVPADTLVSLFDADDIRLSLLSSNGTKHCMKYSATTVPNNDANRDDPFVFRLSEMYLNAAEAACQLQQYAVARQYIGAILTRAVGQTKADAQLAACSDTQLLELIRRERVKELCFEGHNLFDITRWKQNLVREQHTTSTLRRLNYPNDRFVLPIPQTELNANTNMQGNPTVNQ